VPISALGISPRTANSSASAFADERRIPSNVRLHEIGTSVALVRAFDIWNSIQGEKTMNRIRSKVVTRTAIALAGIAVVAGAVWAAQTKTRLQFTPQKELSTTSTLTGATDGENSIKGKLMQPAVRDVAGLGRL
jgi:hypothetical protein